MIVSSLLVRNGPHVYVHPHSITNVNNKCNEPKYEGEVLKSVVQTLQRVVQERKYNLSRCYVDLIHLHLSVITSLKLILVY